MKTLDDVKKPKIHIIQCHVSGNFWLCLNGTGYGDRIYGAAYQELEQAKAIKQLILDEGAYKVIE